LAFTSAMVVFTPASEPSNKVSILPDQRSHFNAATLAAQHCLRTNIIRMVGHPLIFVESVASQFSKLIVQSTSSVSVLCPSTQQSYFHPLSQCHCPRHDKRSLSAKVAHNCPSLGPPHPYRSPFIRNTRPPSLFHSLHFPYSLYSSGGLHSSE